MRRALAPSTLDLASHDQKKADDMVQVITQKSAPSTPDKPIKAITKKRTPATSKKPTQPVKQEPAQAIAKEPTQAIDEKAEASRDHAKAVASNCQRVGANVYHRSCATDGATIRKPNNTTLFAV